MGSVTQSHMDPIQKNEVEDPLSIHLAEQEAILKISQRTLHIGDLDPFISDTMHMARQILKADACLLLERVPDSSTFLIKAKEGWKGSWDEESPLKNALCALVRLTVQDGAPIMTSDLMSDGRFASTPSPDDGQVVSVLTTPILGREESFGVLCAVHYSAHSYARQESNFLQKVGNLLAIAIDQRRTEQPLRTFRDQLALILEGIAEGITVQDEQDRFLYANDIAVRLLGAESRESLLSTNSNVINTRYRLLDEKGQPLPYDRLPGRRALAGEKEVSQIIHLFDLHTGEERWSLCRSSLVSDYFEGSRFVVNIFQDINELKRGEQDLRFLAQAGEVLTGALDYETALQDVAQLAVENLADWCVIHLGNEETGIVQIATANRDPTKVSETERMHLQYLPSPDHPHGIYQVIRTGKPEFYPEISQKALKGMARDENHYRMLASLGLSSAMVLPLMARGHALGTLTMVWGENRLYSEREISLGGELARRAALVIDNVRLYADANHLNAVLEARVAERTRQLEEMIPKLQAEIEERRRVEQELQKSSRLFFGLFNMFPHAVFLVDRDGKITEVNAQGMEMFGYRRGELLGKSIEMLLPISQRLRHGRHRSQYQQAPVRRGMARDVEVFGLQKNGSLIPVEVTLSPVQIAEEWSVITTVRNITEQLNVQAELDEVQHRLIDSQEAERLMLAQELHDGIIQELFSINFQLAEVSRDLIDADLEKLSEKVHVSTEMTQQVIQGLREISRELRPPALAPFGLEQAIHSHMEHFQQVHPELTVHLDLSPDGQMLEERLRLVLFRIYQNAVSNVARHASAKTLWVRLEFDEKSLTLEIRDNGKGFKVPTRWVEMVRGGHLGLVGMRERVEAIGGKLKLISRPGKGTRIQVKVPLNTN